MAQKFRPSVFSWSPAAENLPPVFALENQYAQYWPYGGGTKPARHNR
jgi:hypothetical protein